MNAFLLMVPLFLIRFGLLGLINKDALKRAAYFAPVNGNERIALISYQLSNILIIFYPFALSIKTEPPLFVVGLAVYIIGICVLTVSIINFARPARNAINTGGIYKISRNPMYIGYFVYFLGCVILTRSLLLLLSLPVFQASAHWIILSEERWCINKFGGEYIRYMNNVRRYV